MFKLVTSNENKLKEFQLLGLTDLTIEKGKDLKEVDSDSQTVILYKSLDAGAYHIVEDTSLHVEGSNIGTNIRWLLKDLHLYNNKKAYWEVLIGKNDGQSITVYKGLIEGVLTDKYKHEPKGFGFDCFFIPLGEELTLYDLEMLDRKNEFSARKLAVDNLLNDNFIEKVDIKDIPKWSGLYQ